MKTKKAKQPKTIKILEVDQWTSTGNIENFTFDDFDLSKVKGGDSEAAKKIFGGHARIKEVEENARPSKGCVWYRAGKNGKLERWKSNYDTSD